MADPEIPHTPTPEQQQQANALRDGLLSTDRWRAEADINNLIATLDSPDTQERERSRMILQALMEALPSDKKAEMSIRFIEWLERAFTGGVTVRVDASEQKDLFDEPVGVIEAHDEKDTSTMSTVRRFKEGFSVALAGSSMGAVSYLAKIHETIYGERLHGSADQQAFTNIIEEMTKQVLVKVHDDPIALHTLARLVTQRGGNIDRIFYDEKTAKKALERAMALSIDDSGKTLLERLAPKLHDATIERLGMASIKAYFHGVIQEGTEAKLMNIPDNKPYTDLTPEERGLVSMLARIMERAQKAEKGMRGSGRGMQGSGGISWKKLSERMHIDAIAKTLNDPNVMTEIQTDTQDIASQNIDTSVSDTRNGLKNISLSTQERSILEDYHGIVHTDAYIRMALDAAKIGGMMAMGVGVTIITVPVIGTLGLSAVATAMIAGGIGGAASTIGGRFMNGEKLLEGSLDDTTELALSVILGAVAAGGLVSLMKTAFAMKLVSLVEKGGKVVNPAEVQGYIDILCKTPWLDNKAVIRMVATKFDTEVSDVLMALSQAGTEAGATVADTVINTAFDAYRQHLIGNESNFLEALKQGGILAMIGTAAGARTHFVRQHGADLGRIRESLNAHIANDPNHPDVPFIRQELGRIDTLLAEQGTTNIPLSLSHPWDPSIGDDTTVPIVDDPRSGPAVDSTGQKIRMVDTNNVSRMQRGRLDDVTIGPDGMTEKERFQSRSKVIQGEPHYIPESVPTDASRLQGEFKERLVIAGEVLGIPPGDFTDVQVIAIIRTHFTGDGQRNPDGSYNIRALLAKTREISPAFDGQNDVFNRLFDAGVCYELPPRKRVDRKLTVEWTQALLPDAHLEEIRAFGPDTPENPLRRWYTEKMQDFNRAKEEGDEEKMRKIIQEANDWIGKPTIAGEPIKIGHSSSSSWEIPKDRIPIEITIDPPPKATLYPWFKPDKRGTGFLSEQGSSTFKIGVDTATITPLGNNTYRVDLEMQGTWHRTAIVKPWEPMTIQEKVPWTRWRDLPWWMRERESSQEVIRIRVTVNKDGWLDLYNGLWIESAINNIRIYPSAMRDAMKNFPQDACAFAMIGGRERLVYIYKHSQDGRSITVRFSGEDGIDRTCNLPIDKLRTAPNPWDRVFVRRSDGSITPWEVILTESEEFRIEVGLWKFRKIDDRILSVSPREIRQDTIPQGVGAFPPFRISDGDPLRLVIGSTSLSIEQRGDRAFVRVNGKEYPIADTPLTVGRFFSDSTADIQISDTQAARNHLTIARNSDGTFTVTDNGTIHGTHFDRHTTSESLSPPQEGVQTPPPESLHRPQERARFLTPEDFLSTLTDGRLPRDVPTPPIDISTRPIHLTIENTSLSIEQCGDRAFVRVNGKEYPLTHIPLPVGRKFKGSPAVIQIPGDWVSRIHLTITCNSDGTITLTDTSTNGTRVVSSVWQDTSPQRERTSVKGQRMSSEEKNMWQSEIFNADMASREHTALAKKWLLDNPDNPCIDLMNEPRLRQFIETASIQDISSVFGDRIRMITFGDERTHDIGVLNTTISEADMRVILLAHCTGNNPNGSVDLHAKLKILEGAPHLSQVDRNRLIDSRASGLWLSDIGGATRPWWGQTIESRIDTVTRVESIVSRNGEFNHYVRLFQDQMKKVESLLRLVQSPKDGSGKINNFDTFFRRGIEDAILTMDIVAKRWRDIIVTDREYEKKRRSIGVTSDEKRLIKETIGQIDTLTRAIGMISLNIRDNSFHPSVDASKKATLRRLIQRLHEQNLVSLWGEDNPPSIRDRLSELLPSD